MHEHGEDWRARGACRGLDPELFYPRRGEPTAAATAVCQACPVRGPCLDYALDARELFGIWGGESERGRRELRRRRRAA